MCYNTHFFFSLSSFFFLFFVKLGTWKWVRTFTSWKKIIRYISMGLRVVRRTIDVRALATGSLRRSSSRVWMFFLLSFWRLRIGSFFFSIRELHAGTVGTLQSLNEKVIIEKSPIQARVFSTILIDSRKQETRENWRRLDLSLEQRKNSHPTVRNFFFFHWKFQSLNRITIPRGKINSTRRKFHSE